MRGGLGWRLKISRSLAPSPGIRCRATGCGRASGALGRLASNHWLIRCTAEPPEGRPMHCGHGCGLHAQATVRPSVRGTVARARGGGSGPPGASPPRSRPGVRRTPGITGPDMARGAAIMARGAGCNGRVTIRRSVVGPPGRLPMVVMGAPESEAGRIGILSASNQAGKTTDTLMHRSQMCGFVEISPRSGWPRAAPRASPPCGRPGVLRTPGITAAAAAPGAAIMPRVHLPYMEARSPYK